LTSIKIKDRRNGAGDIEFGSHQYSTFVPEMHDASMRFRCVGPALRITGVKDVRTAEQLLLQLQQGGLGPGRDSPGQ
jgi:hypothetical protein